MDISDRILDLLKKIIPKPDITFLLVGDSQILYERKKEIPIEEIERQIQRIKKKQNKFNNSVIIDVNKSIEEVVEDVSIQILKECSLQIKE